MVRWGPYRNRVSILPDWEIQVRCDGLGMVEGYDPDLINPASLDLRLGTFLQVEQRFSRRLRLLDIGWATEQRPYWLWPRRFVLAETLEIFNLPDDIAGQFVLKSSRAREGTQHMLAGYCDPGWHGSRLTLELTNCRFWHALPLWPGMKIGQMVFHQMSERPLRSYVKTGRYNGDRRVTASKG